MTATALIRIPSVDDVQFADLYIRYRPAVARVVTKFVRYHPDDREDIVQNVFLRAFRFRDTFRGDCQFSTWLSQIAFTESMMFLRRLKREESCFTGQLLVEPSDGSRDFLDRLADTELLAKSMSGLPQHDRQLLFRAHSEQASHEDLAIETGYTASNIKTRLFRARNLVRPRVLALSRVMKKGAGA